MVLFADVILDNDAGVGDEVSLVSWSMAAILSNDVDVVGICVPCIVASAGSTNKICVHALNACVPVVLLADANTV